MSVETTTEATQAEQGQLMTAISGFLGNNLFGGVQGEPSSGDHAPEGKAEDQQAPATADPEQPDAETAETKVDTEATDGADKAPDSGKPKTRHDKAEERAAKQWKLIEAEKEKLKAEKAELEKLRAEAAQKPPGYTPEEFEKLAKQFEEEGNAELAEKARAAANSTRVENIRRVQMTDFDKLKVEHPELADEQSELYKAAVGIYRGNPVLSTYPGGLRDAVERAVALNGARQAKSLAAEIAQLKAQLAEYQKLTTPASGGKTAAAPPSRAGKTPTKAELLDVLREAQIFGR